MALSLKRLTAEPHRRAETAVLATGLFQSRERYVAYLERVHGFYRAIEPRLLELLCERCTPALRGLGMHERRKLPWLERDLAALGRSSRAIRSPSSPPRVPRIATVQAALGVAYVLEGKTLGARFLLEEAQARLGLRGPDDGAAFLAGYGADTATRWTTYRTALEAFVSAHGRRIAILDAARATFEAFIRTAAVVPF